MRYLFLRFNNWISKGSGLGGCIRIPDQGKSIHNSHKTTYYPIKGHSSAQARYKGQEVTSHITPDTLHLAGNRENSLNSNLQNQIGGQDMAGRFVSHTESGPYLTNY